MIGTVFALSAALWVAILGVMLADVRAKRLDDPAPLVGFIAPTLIVLVVIALGYFLDAIIRWIVR